MKRSILALALPPLLSLPAAAGLTDGGNETTLTPSQAISLLRDGRLIEQGRTFVDECPLKLGQNALARWCSYLGRQQEIRAVHEQGVWVVQMPMLPMVTAGGEEVGQFLNVRLREVQAGDESKGATAPAGSSGAGAAPEGGAGGGAGAGPGAGAGAAPMAETGAGPAQSGKPGI